LASPHAPVRTENVAPARRSPAPVAGLRLRSVSKRFPGTQALQDVSFEVSRGTIHALMGGNGSGKSTLIKILAGVYRGEPGGSVACGNVVERSDRITPAWAAAAGLRFVHQDLGLFERLSVAENLFAGRRVPRRHGGLSWRRLERMAQERLDRLEIPVAASALLASQRPADRTLVAIARALPGPGEANSTLLVLDEPTARLAPAETQKLLVALRRYAGQGQSILFVSHRLDEIFGLAESATVLRDGRVARTGPLSDLDEAALVESMVGHALVRDPRIRRTSGGAPVLKVSQLASGSLTGIDLTVDRGEVVGVAGLVGSGRTQLLEAIFGARPLDAGTVEIDGGIVRGGIAAAIRRGISLVPEDRGAEGIFASLGIAENLSAADSGRYSKRLVFRHSAERRDAARVVADLQVRATSAQAIVHTLSGGNQQKVVLGRWLGMAPKLLLLDEPTQGVDVAAREDLYRQIDAAAARGCAVILVSSAIEELLRLADRVVVLSGGQIVAQAAGELLTHGWLAERMY
jgi:ribose transport system ATP-binding protein